MNPSANSRYTTEMLNTAYENIYWRKHGDKDIGLMIFPFDNEVEVEFHLPKESADILMKDLFRVLYLVDDIVNKEDCKTISYDYDIACLLVFDNRVTIVYFGNKVNTEFNVEVFKEAGRWYCEKIGMRKFNPPMCLTS